jgi:hypothetical protein
LRSYKNGGSELHFSSLVKSAEAEDDTGEADCKNWANKFCTNNLKVKSQRKRPLLES